MVGANAPSSSVHGYASVHVTSFSYIHASRPTGESARLNPSVCGLVVCSAEYPLPFLMKLREAAAASRSRDVKDVKKHLSSVMGFSWNLGRSPLKTIHRETMRTKMRIDGEQFRQGGALHGHV